MSTLFHFQPVFHLLFFSLYKGCAKGNRAVKLFPSLKLAEQKERFTNPKAEVSGTVSCTACAITVQLGPGLTHGIPDSSKTVA